MIDFKKYLTITQSVLFVGLKNDWLTAKETVAIINENNFNLNFDEITLVDINLNEDNKIILLDILQKKLNDQEIAKGMHIWQISYLRAIKNSNISIHQKLREIEIQWSKFDYPESWRNFIYYMPNEKTNSEEDIYLNFLDKG
ncbi:DUF2247 family protein [Epilithonimonas hungarica]|uniref:Uncharacterized protein n=1 Tax=Epilithonimonas hungarica TaxID=454006 RepID=A0A1G7W312_9FLAO|nr:DUF2247 family protein [Epilithonimonas hungarica]SDG66109.1 hypothetical protein SAMN05421825_3785 [Epilithonimonas hungarica]